MFTKIWRNLNDSEYAMITKLRDFEKRSLREKCPNAEFFLVRIFPHSDWIRRYTPYVSVFSPNPVKYGPEKTPYSVNSF